MFACYFKWKPVCNGSKRGISVKPSNFRTGWKRRPSRDEGRLMAVKPFHHNLTVSYHSWKSTGASAVSGKSHLIPVTKRNEHKNSKDSEQNKSSDWGRVGDVRRKTPRSEVIKCREVQWSTDLNVNLPDIKSTTSEKKQTTVTPRRGKCPLSSVRATTLSSDWKGEDMWPLFDQYDQEGWL